MYDPKYFALTEFNCQETNQNEMQPEFLKRMDALRKACGFPFVITSGYRSPNLSMWTIGLLTIVQLHP